MDRQGEKRDQVMEMPEGGGMKPPSLREKAAFFLLALFFFLLPLKFGGIAVAPESCGYFPEEWSHYLFSSWPPVALGIFSGAILLLSLGGAPLWSRTQWLWSTGFLLAALPGLSAGVGEVTGLLFAYLAAVASLSLAAFRLARRFPWAPECFCILLLVGALLAACNGFFQFFFGFEELRNFVAAEQAKGIVLPESLLLKLNDTRITSFLVSSNALAGFLLMALPAALFFGRKWGRCFTPVSVSVVLFESVFILLSAGALYLTGARSALVVSAALLSAALFSSPKLSVRKKWFGAGILLLFLAAGAAFLLWRGRAFTSMGERADYLRSCAVMSCEHPLAGGGWGSFHFRHMEIKVSATDEAARDPHNLIASYAAQAGIPAGIFVGWLLLFPLWKLWKFRFSGVCGVIFWISFAFVLHTLMDSDMLSPALFGSFCILSAAGMARETPVASEAKWKSVAGNLCAGAVAFSAIASGMYWSAGEYLLARFQGGIFPQSEEDMRHTAPAEIRERYETLRRLRPSCALVPESMGLWHERRFEFPQAEACFAEARRIEPRRPSIYRHLSRMACRKGDFPEAARCREEALRRFPKAPKKLERMMKP